MAKKKTAAKSKSKRPTKKKSTTKSASKKTPKKSTAKKTTSKKSTSKKTTAKKSGAKKRPGLWANIHAKHKRIEAGSGEKMRKPGDKGAPSSKSLHDSQRTSKK